MNINNIYSILILLSAVAYLLGLFESLNELFVMVLLLSTFFKAKLVLDYFMELKTTSLLYRILPSVWLFIVLSLIGLAYYF